MKTDKDIRFLHLAEVITKKPWKAVKMLSVHQDREDAKYQDKIISFCKRSDGWIFFPIVLDNKIIYQGSSWKSTFKYFSKNFSEARSPSFSERILIYFFGYPHFYIYDPVKKKKRIFLLTKSVKKDKKQMN